MKIIKADGSREEFRPNKLIASLRRAGAGRDEISRIVQAVEQSLREGMKTQQIYQKAFQLLRESNEPVAAKYSLRRAVFNLGPTGFPFEDFLGKLFEAEGYKTKRRLTLRGRCAVHEVDVAAYSPDHSFVAEAKFHARPGVKSDLQVAMYSYARWLDLESARVCEEDECGVISLCVVTNTKFTSAAIKYAECTGIKLLSWNYPKGDSLQDKIERHRVYPITVLSRLSSGQKQRLLEAGVILCSELLKKPGMLKKIGVPEHKIKAIFEEISVIDGKL